MISSVTFGRAAKQKSKPKTALNIAGITAAAGTAIYYSGKTTSPADKSIVDFFKNLGHSVKNIVASNEKLSKLTGTLDTKLSPINEKIQKAGNSFVKNKKTSSILNSISGTFKSAKEGVKSFVNKKIAKKVVKNTPDIIKGYLKSAVDTVKRNPVTFATIAALLLSAKLLLNKGKSDK